MVSTSIMDSKNKNPIYFVWFIYKKVLMQKKKKKLNHWLCWGVSNGISYNSVIIIINRDASFQAKSWIQALAIFFRPYVSVIFCTNWTILDSFQAHSCFLLATLYYFYSIGSTGSGASAEELAGGTGCGSLPVIVTLLTSSVTMLDLAAHHDMLQLAINLLLGEVWIHSVQFYKLATKSYYNTTLDFFSPPNGNILEYSKIFQNICARNIPPCLPAEFLALCLSVHGMHRFCSSAIVEEIWVDRFM